MQTADSISAAPRAARAHFKGPVWTLLVLAPVIAEVLSGSTRTSILFVLIPEIMVWGVGALLCRELVRRWRAGGVSLLTLGLALSVAEEFVIQQTSIAPLPFPGAHADYGRIWGINLVYLLFMLAYESVWVVLVPVSVTELIFPDRRELPWLGLQVAAVVLVGVDARRLHALLETPHEARPLVLRVVESSRLVHEVEELFEPGIELRAHARAPGATMRLRAGPISAAGRTWSTAPVSMAAPGIPKNCADALS